MRKFMIFGFLCILMSCSSVVVSDSWKNVDMSTMTGEKMLVIGRTADNVVRSRIENDMVTSLKEVGFDAVPSYSKIPKVDPSKKADPNKVEALKKEIMSEGINLVMMVVLKDKETYEKSTSDYNGYGYPGYPGYYGAGFYRGFGTYYGSMYNYGYQTTTTEQANKYIVETVVYDISKPEGKSLVAVVTTDIDDPSSLSKTASDLGKKVSSELMRK